MTAVALTVNARTVTADIEPRTPLADFLRDTLDLTGTHLGCEHGVCGACTLMIDGAPARSCITYAVACQGAAITTIEGLDQDDIAGELRAAFTREHALQCGYCTPGMLMSARDLVLRLHAANEQDIRIGLSGNLCRCTGYVGIVKAVRSVIAARRARGIEASAGAGRTALGPVGSSGAAVAVRAAPIAREQASIGPVAAISAVPDFIPSESFETSFTVAHPQQTVFDLFGDSAAVAACLPGASLTGTPTPERIDGAIRVTLGPIAANFQGAARLMRDPATLSGRIVGIGNDARSRSSTQGEIRYRLAPRDDGRATRVDLTVGYSLKGMLAQIARAGLVRDLAAKLTVDFARNLDRHLSGATVAQTAKPLNGLSLLFGLLRSRAALVLRRLAARRDGA